MGSSLNVLLISRRRDPFKEKFNILTKEEPLTNGYNSYIYPHTRGRMFHRVGAHLLGLPRHYSLADGTQGVPLLPELMGLADVIGKRRSLKSLCPRPQMALKVQSSTLNWNRQLV